MKEKGVKVIKRGETTFVFHDDYCRDKTPAEIKAILDHIASIAFPALRAAAYKKETSTSRTSSA